MNRFAYTTMIGLLAVSISTNLASGESRYQGKVGKLEAVFTLNWGPGENVSGSYHYPSRPGTVYRLTGSNPREGVLVLDEFTDGRRTARCDLRKSVDGASITWEGTMHNADGRKFAMSFARDGIGGAAVRPAITGERRQLYRGKVGKLDAEFSLVWKEDGTVSGTYSYPSRRGVTYHLSGNNPRGGEIFLDEYTGRNLTANCGLVKRLTDSHIVWIGVMQNTDGRRFEMYFYRDRKRVAEAGAATPREPRRVVAKTAEVTRWAEPPSRKRKLPFGYDMKYVEGTQVLDARVKSSSYNGAVLEVELKLLETDWDSFEIVVPTSEKAVLRVDYPGGANPFLNGERCQVAFGPDGQILHIYVNDIAVTHWRKRADGRVEVRGVPWTEDLAGGSEGHEAPHLTEEQLKGIELRELVPDKLVLENEVFDEIYWRSIYFTADVGLMVWIDGAGPGELSLERISLGIDRPREEPWISVKKRAAGKSIPDSQLAPTAG